MTTFFFSLLILLLPVQLGYHFWPKFSFVWGLKVDYLSPTIYLTDIVILLLLISWGREKIRRYDDMKIWRVIKQLEIKKLIDKKKLLYSVVFVFLIINCLLAKNFGAAFYKLIKIMEMGLLVWYVKEKTELKFYCSSDRAKRGSRELYLNDNFSTPVAFGDLRSKNILSLFSILTFLTISVFYSSIIAIVQFLKQGSIGGLFYWLGERTFTSSTPGIAQISLAGRLLLRPYATFPHPNVLGGFLALSLPLILLTLKDGSSSKTRPLLERIFYSLTFLFGLIALFLTFSRSAILAFIIGIIILNTFDKFTLSEIEGLFTSLFRDLIKKRKMLKHPPAMRCEVSRAGVQHDKRRRQVLPLIFIMLLTICYILLITNIQSPESLTYRKQLNNIAFSMIAKNPVFGVGLNNFIPSMVDYKAPGTVVRFFQPVHSIYLLIMSETGVVGLGLFLWLIFRTLNVLSIKYQVLSNKNKKYKYIIRNTLYIILFLSFFDHYFLTLQQGMIMTALVIGYSHESCVN